MCKIIDFDVFLGIILEEKYKIQFRKIREIVEYFESSSVVIDVSSGAVASALSHYPDVFAVSRKDKCFSRAPTFDGEFVKEEFKSSISSDVIKQIYCILNKSS